jgi:hypothetical protein
MDITSKTNSLLHGGNDNEMSLTIKYLLENPILLHPPQNNGNNEKSKEDKLYETSPNDLPSAYLGPQIWNDMLLSDDLKLEPVDLEDLLDGSNGEEEMGDLGLLMCEPNKQQQQQQQQAQHSPDPYGDHKKQQQVGNLQQQNTVAQQIQQTNQFFHQQPQQQNQSPSPNSVPLPLVVKRVQNRSGSVGKNVNNSPPHSMEQQQNRYSLQWQPQNNIRTSLDQQQQQQDNGGSPLLKVAYSPPHQNDGNQYGDPNLNYNPKTEMMPSPEQKGQFPANAYQPQPQPPMISPQGQDSLSPQISPVGIRIPSPVQNNYRPNNADVLISTPRTADGKEFRFDPTTRVFTEDELKPQPIIRKSRKIFVTADNKDMKYWNRRKKNNVAAKRSREARRIKENQIAMRANFLEQENTSLKTECRELRKELTRAVDLLRVYEKAFPSFRKTAFVAAKVQKTHHHNIEEMYN